MAVSGSAPSRPFFCGRNKHRAIPIRCGFRDTQLDIQRSTVRDDLSLSCHSSFVFLSALPHVFMTVCNCASEKRADDFKVATIFVVHKIPFVPASEPPRVCRRLHLLRGW